MDFDTFIHTAWNDHADHPRDVAERLAATLDIVDGAQRVPPFARLVTHVYGEHLGEWQQGIALLERLRAVPAFDASPAADGSVTQGIATLRYASGDRDALARLAADAQITVLAAAASMFGGRGDFAAALASYAEALRLAANGLPVGSPAVRALAVGGNNLAVALEGKTGRKDREIAGMVMAAEKALEYWKQAGTWLEEERAEYRLARSLLQAGRPAEAVDPARRCVAVCERHDAPPFERFFAHAVLALAARAAGDNAAGEAAREQALAFLACVPDDEKAWCEGDRRELES